MAVNQKMILVYDDFSTDQSVLMGCLYINVIKGGESYSLNMIKNGWKKQDLLWPWIRSLCRMLEDSIPTERTYLACLPMRLPTAGDECLWINAKEFWQKRKGVSLLNFMTVITYLAYTMKLEWEVFVLSQRRKDHSFLNQYWSGSADRCEIRYFQIGCGRLCGRYLENHQR